MKEAPLFAFAQRLNMMKKGNEKKGGLTMPISKKMSGFRWALEQALRRFLTLAGAVLLAWLLLAPKEQPPRRVYLLGGPVSAEYGGIALPVEIRRWPGVSAGSSTACGMTICRTFTPAWASGRTGR